MTDSYPPWPWLLVPPLLPCSHQGSFVCKWQGPKLSQRRQKKALLGGCWVWDTLQHRHFFPGQQIAESGMMDPKHLIFLDQL